jgi:hypothetical protein
MNENPRYVGERVKIEILAGNRPENYLFERQ